MGDRRSNITRAVALISTLDCITDVRSSSIVESAPWGYDSPCAYLNQGLVFNTCLPPMELFKKLQRIERSICADSHRTADGSYADRVIDIDLIAVEGVTMNVESGPDHPALTLPHPRAATRPFVMIPLLECLTTL